jgi:hypothetical protein
VSARVCHPYPTLLGERTATNKSGLARLSPPPFNSCFIDMLDVAACHI